MRVIPVIDLMYGRAVHARGGDRGSYRPVRSVLTSRADDPLELALAYRAELDTSEVYVADLDAIAEVGSRCEIVRTLVQDGASVWLDAGVSRIDQAAEMLTLGAARVVVGLETLDAAKSLTEIVHEFGGERVVFSLDLRQRAPIVSASWELSTDPIEMARWASGQGVGALIVLDLARVGRGAGVDLELLDSVRAVTHGIELVAGGGVGTTDDLRALRDAGCDAALVATALHDGRLRGVDLAAFGVARH